MTATPSMTGTAISLAVCMIRAKLSHVLTACFVSMLHVCWQARTRTDSAKAASCVRGCKKEKSNFQITEFECQCRANAVSPEGHSCSTHRCRLALSRYVELIVQRCRDVEL